MVDRAAERPVASECADRRDSCVGVHPSTFGEVLAFDFGTRRIGVALGQPQLGTAQPIDVIDVADNATRFARIAALIEQWRPQCLIVGEPRHADGAAHDMTARAQRFARQLRGRFGLPVELVDERLTSVEAESLLRAAGRRDVRRHVDALAAQRILLTWFDDAARR